MQRPSRLGMGLGLRPAYYQDIIETKPPVDWFEIISENYMVPGGRPLAVLDRIRSDYPLVMHGVSMSIGATTPLDIDYLAALKALAERVEPAWISDHLCWTGVHGVNLHDLMPLPYTEEAIAHVAERIARVQDYLGRRIAIENVSSYVTFTSSEMDEWTFVQQVADRADCWLLIDVNNICVSAFNHDFDASAFLRAIKPERVVQLHLAGHTDCGTHKIDTHDQPIAADVFKLYAEACRHFGMLSTLIERDDNFPPFAELLGELDAARRIAAGLSESTEAPADDTQAKVLA